jgi:hypothetical protein
MWDKTTVILLGDVYYTQRALSMILNSDDECMFYGNAGEIFALRFRNNTIYKHLINLCYSGVDNLKLWNLYRAVENIPQNVHSITLRADCHFRFIDDGTRDIDTPGDVVLLTMALHDMYREVEHLRERI